MQMVVIASEKGGVGKTTTAVQLAEGLALTGRPTVLIDLDQQANATQTLLGHTPSLQALTVADLLVDDTLALNSVVQPTRTPGLRLLPANKNLIAADDRVRTQPGGDGALARRLAELPASTAYAVIDLAPGTTRLHVAALRAATTIIIPVIPGQYELQGLMGLHQTIGVLHAARSADERPQMRVLLTQLDRRRALDREVEAAIRQVFGAAVFATTIPFAITLRDAARVRDNLYTVAPESAGAIAYARLVQEVLADEPE